MRRTSPATRVLCRAAAFAVAVVCARPLSAAQADFAPPQSSESAAKALATTDAAARANASTWLVDHAGLADHAETIEVITRTLAAPLTPGGPGVALLEAIAASSNPAPALLEPLCSRLRDAKAEEQPSLLAAIGAFRSRYAANILLDHTGGDASEETAAAAYKALGNLAASNEFGEDHEAWAAWLRSFENRNELEWQHAIATNLAMRLASQRAVQTTTITRLIDVTRRLHLATPADQRPALLVDLLRDRLPELRDLGFELVQRELSNNGSIDDRVGTAAVELLSDPTPRVRGQAAVLVRQIAPPGAADAVAAALERETDPQAASDLLLAATRWPTPACVSGVLAWTKRQGNTRPAAIEACLQMKRSGSLSQADTNSVLALLRATPSYELTGAGTTLLVEAGEEPDRGRVVPLLTSSSPAIRLAAAESLMWFPDYTDTIIDAAVGRPELFPAASKAVMVHAPTAALIVRILSLQAVTPEVARANLAMLARNTPADVLLDALSHCRDQAQRSVLLSSLTSQARLMSAPQSESSLAAVSEAVLIAVDEDLTAGDAAAALSLIDAANFFQGDGLIARAAKLRAAALIASGKLEDPALAAAPLEAWMRGYSLAKSSSLGPKVAGEILSRFGDAIAPDQRSELQNVRVNADFVGPPEAR